MMVVFYSNFLLDKLVIADGRVLHREPGYLNLCVQGSPSFRLLETQEEIVLRHLLVVILITLFSQVG